MRALKLARTAGWASRDFQQARLLKLAPASSSSRITFFTRLVRVCPWPGRLWTFSETDYRRNSFFGMTGTYYDKDLTDIVYRYDLLYQPDHAVARSEFRQPDGIGVDPVYTLDYRG